MHNIPIDKGKISLKLGFDKRKQAQLILHTTTGGRVDQEDKVNNKNLEEELTKVCHENPMQNNNYSKLCKSHKPRGKGKIKKRKGTEIESYFVHSISVMLP